MPIYRDIKKILVIDQAHNNQSSRNSTMQGLKAVYPLEKKV